MLAKFFQTNKCLRKKILKNTHYTLACIGLHNYLRLTDNPSYFPAEFVDSQNGNRETWPGDWRNLVTETNRAVRYVKNVRCCCSTEDAVEMRDGIMSYVN